MDRKKKINKGLLNIIILAFTIMGFMNISYAGGEFYVQVNLGFDGYVRSGELAPIEIEVTNNFQDLEGKIQFLIEQNINNKYGYIAYSKDLNIAKGTTKNIKMNIFSEQSSFGYKVRILDKNDKVIWENKKRTELAISKKKLAIGILSDDIDSLKYLGLVHYDEANTFEVVNISNIVPEEEELLNSFEVIILSNYNIETLNNKQIENIENWVESGGVVLLESESNYFNRFIEFKDLEFTEIQENKYQEGKIYKGVYGKGKVISTTFNLGLRPFIEWEGKINFLSELLQNEINILDDIDELNVKTNLYRTKNVIGNIPIEKIPSLKVIILILLSFVIIVGPLNYLILKRIDKREKGWITIPIIVVAFSIFIYIWGFGTRFDDPISNNISIIEMDKDLKVGKIETISGLTDFQDGDLDVTIPENSISSMFNEMGYINTNGFENGDIFAEKLFKEDKYIIFKNTGVWDIQYINIKEKIEGQEFISSDLTIGENEIIGKITNVSPYQLEDVVVLISEQYIEVGDMTSGESKDISYKFKIKNRNMNINPRDIGYTIYLGNRNNPMNKEERSDILNDNIKGDVLSEYIESNAGGISLEDIQIIAWNRASISSDIKVNGREVERIDRNLIVIPANIKYKKDSNIEIPYGVLKPKIEKMDNLEFSRYEKSVIGEGEIIYLFKADENINLESMNIKLDGNGDVWIFNYYSKQWEGYENNLITIDKISMDRYYDERKGVRVKIKNASKQKQTYMPEFSIKGVAR